MTDMIDRTQVDGRVLVVADRGYNSYNVMAHTEEKGWFYLIRTHGSHKRNSILSKFDLPVDEEFDQEFSIRLTRRQTKEIKADKRYRLLPKKSTFDYLQLNPDIVRVLKLNIFIFKFFYNIFYFIEVITWTKYRDCMGIFKNNFVILLSYLVVTSTKTKSSSFKILESSK